MSIHRRQLLQLGAAGTASAIGTRVPASGAASGGGRAPAPAVFDVVVVGGGFSGMVAARDLKRAGLDNMLVLEARKRVGGRSYNMAVGDGLYSNAGPTWVGPGQTAIANLLRELGIATERNFDRGDAVLLLGGQTQRIPTQASPVSDRSLIEELEALALTVPASAPWAAERAAEFDAMTFADFLATRQLSEMDQMSLRILTQLTFGAMPEDISFLYVLFYINSAGGYDLLESMEGGAQQDRIVGGTQSVPLRIARELGSIVRNGQPVSQISDWQPDASGPVRLETPDGEVRARAVIMALSPSQANDIMYAPALPPRRAGIMAHWPRGGSAIKVAAVYEKPFWREQGLSGQSYSPDGPYLWTVDVSPGHDSHGHLMSFTMSAAMPPMTSEQRRQAILEAHARCFGPQALSPIGYAELDWSQETYTRGCVSPLTKGVLTRYGSALRPPSGKLVWAGTETSDIWMGYMDGAVRAGQRAALEALGALSGRVA